jgi:pimeloyl-ACP methyl ester carboxylesterase
VRFLLPIGPSRRTAAETVWKKMKSVFDNPNFDRVSIIAHSFGTWIVGYLLQTKELRFHRVIFCGAILDSKFDWETVTRKVDHPHWSDAPNAYVLNDCGTKDIWPIFAKFATWGYGISGRWGFQNALVRDRFHEVDHSGFFQDGFATRNWVPALTATSLSKGVDRGIDPSMLVSLMTITKLPYILIVIAVIVIYLLRR